MAGVIPDARIRMHPDSAHAFLFQGPEQVAVDVNTFFGMTDHGHDLELGFFLFVAT